MSRAMGDQPNMMWSPNMDAPWSPDMDTPLAALPGRSESETWVLLREEIMADGAEKVIERIRTCGVNEYDVEVMVTRVRRIERAVVDVHGGPDGDMPPYKDSLLRKRIHRRRAAIRCWAQARMGEVQRRGVKAVKEDLEKTPALCAGDMVAMRNALNNVYLRGGNPMTWTRAYSKTTRALEL